MIIESHEGCHVFMTEVSMAPSEVQLLSIASTSAVVGWTPGSSALEHIITVNSVVRTTIRPGGYRCTITGKYRAYIPEKNTRYGSANLIIIGNIQVFLT